MADLLAVCERCSTIFLSSNVVAGDGGILTMTNVRVGPCPNCQAMGQVPDGDYRLTNDTLRLLRSHSPEQLTRLLNILQTHRQAPDLLDRVKQEAPELAEIVEPPGQTGTDRRFWVEMLIALVLFALGPAYDELFEDQPPSPEEIARVVREELPRQPAKPAQLQPAPAQLSTSKHPRNAPCPCGSEKKYKKCHGSHPSARPSSD